MTNLLLTLFMSTNIMLHWERSPDTSVVSYTLYASPVSRFTNQWVPGESTPPQVGSNSPPSVVRARSVRVGTNTAWQATAMPIPAGSATSFVLGSPLDSARLFFSVTATDNTGAESDLSNEILFQPRWLWVSFSIEASRDLTNWAVIGQTNLFRVWRPTEGAAYFRGRMVLAP